MSVEPGRPVRPPDADIRAALSQIGRVPELLVACDYDGTLAPLVDDPSTAAPLPEAVAALRSLAALPQTTVAVVSGRALRDLAGLSRLPSEVHLVGSHGSEFDLGFIERLDPELLATHRRLHEAAVQLAHDHKGVRVETKPASVALHIRSADPAVGKRAIAAWLAGPATWTGVYVTHGKQVVELSVLETDKGAAVHALRIQSSASAVLFLGDDVTDERAFAALHGPDIGIKVGPGDTRAAYRVDNPIEAVRALGWVLEARRQWLYGEQAVPIERHALLSNGSTVALLTPDARVTWLCHPRPDSAALLAEILGGPRAGFFSARPDRPGIPLGQRYAPGTMTVETRWPGLTVTDWLEGSTSGDVTRPSGGGTPCSLVRVLTGSVSTRLEFAPRPEFGQILTRLEAVDDALVVHGSNAPLMTLYGPGVQWEVFDDGGHESARALVDLEGMGGQLTLELRLESNHSDAPVADSSEDRRADAERPWADWAASLRLPGVSPAMVLRSALTLKGLCHSPTGSILAAATTSLPEDLGGVRNWDYRYCWLRDAAMSARVLVDLGSLTEAEAFLDWVDGCCDRTDGHPERLHPLYTVDGQELGPEAVIETLPGYAGSRPVRVGNAANRQIQLDVFGPIVDLVLAVVEARGFTRNGDWRLVERMVQAVARRWHEPDHGVWEARIAPRHHVYSKVMCWVTVDRALRLHERCGGGAGQEEWVALRESIRRDVLTHGWNEAAGAFSVAYDDPGIDASSLWVGLGGLVPDDDPRFLATVLRVESALRSGPVVYRYRWDDGLPGSEGGFHICTAWLIEAYLRTGRRGDAEELFEQMIGTAGPTGLLPEQFDPIAERGLGNHPQAYSHLGVIRCALALDAARPSD